MVRSARRIMRFVVGAAGVSCAWTGCSSPLPCGLDSCDVRDAHCQQMASAAAACLRQVSPATVPVTVMSQAEYIQQQTSGEPPTPDQENAFRIWNDALALFGLAPPHQSLADAARVSGSWVGAFYDQSDKSITILDDGQPLDSIYFVSMLVHEYEHAIQDARFGIKALYAANPGGRDANQATSAMIEGEASIVGDRALVDLFGDSPDDVPWQRVFSEWKDSQRKSALASTNPVTLAYSTFAYAFGTPYMHDAIATGGWQGADDVFATLPVSARQVMAGFGAADPAVGPWSEDLGADAVPVLDARFSLESTARMGAWIVSLLLARANLHLLDDPAKQMTADELSVFQDQTTAAAVAVWRLRVGSPELASSVREALEAQLFAQALGWGAVRLQTIDRDLVLVSATDPLVLSAIPDALTFQPVPRSTTASPIFGDSTNGSTGTAGALIRCSRRF